MKSVLLCLLLTTAAHAAGDLSRYQPIIDRLPFGGTAGGATTANQPNFAGRFALVGMVSSNFPSGQVQAIILDKTAGNKTYFRSEGEMIDGAKIVKINDELPNRSVVIQQGLETATLVYETRRGPTPGTTLPRTPLTGVPMPGMTAAPGTEPAAETVPETPATPPTTPTPVTPGPRRIPFRR